MQLRPPTRAPSPPAASPPAHAASAPPAPAQSRSPATPPAAPPQSRSFCSPPPPPPYAGTRSLPPSPSPSPAGSSAAPAAPLAASVRDNGSRTASALQSFHANALPPPTPAKVHRMSQFHAPFHPTVQDCAGSPCSESPPSPSSPP